jgi:hypothetical protein
MSAHPMLWPQLHRGDRTVQRVHLRLAAGIPQSRVTFALEEALRLVALPGEDEGRAFYFRRVSLQSLPIAASRSLWLDTCQSALRGMAERAVHGRAVTAAAAEAVFFLSQQEALEWFLNHLLRASALPQWFAPMISGVAAHEPPAVQFVAAIERLRQLPSGWFAAATSLFASLPSGTRPVADLLASVPSRLVAGWLSELGATNASSRPSPPLSIEKLSSLLDIFAAIGFNTSAVDPNHAQPASAKPYPNPWQLWLAALAIVSEHPAELPRGSLIALSRALITQLSQSTSPASRTRKSLTASAASFAHRSAEIWDQANRSHATSASGNPVHDTARSASASAQETDSNVPTYLPLSTEAAGLYFLLNPIARLGIESAFEQAPQLFRFGFLPRLLLALAVKARIAPDDPALNWVRLELAASNPAIEPTAATAPEPTPADPHAPAVPAARCWPLIFTAPPQWAAISTARLVRLWALAVRRWCWRHTGLGLAEIVNRPGRIQLTRADLDVTLSLDSVDLRLRRAGLDLGLGWVPWFGRVVRFHYHVPLPGARLPRNPRAGVPQ